MNLHKSPCAQHGPRRAGARALGGRGHGHPAVGVAQHPAQVPDVEEGLGLQGIQDS